MQSTCEICGKVFDHSTGNHRRFCSTECRKQSTEKRVGKLYCQVCGNEIVKDKRKGKLFCSQACYGEYVSRTRKGVSRPEVSGPRPDRQSRVILTCQRCGKEYQVKKSHEHRSKYCSKECTKNQCTVKCHQCGQAYNVKAAEAERTRFCSKECHASWMSNRTGEDNPRYNRIDTPCAQCGTIVHVVPFSASVNKHFFCCRKCYNQWYSKNKSGENSHEWKGGTKKWRGASWKRQQRAAIQRDSHTCQHCHKTQKQLHKMYPKNYRLQVHHIIPFRKFGIKRESEANALENLITLCPSCHQKAERGNIPIQPYLLSIP